MEIKKSPEADLEKGRLTFFLIGFAVALSGFFVLIEWQESEPENSDWASLGPVFIENEFEKGIRTEETVLTTPHEITAPPEILEPKIVYEDYTITKDIPVVEKLEEPAITPLNPESDKTLLSHPKNEINTQSETEENAMTATSAEIMPQFPGGQTALIRFIYQNIQYPSAALKQRIEGRVWCSFVVEMDGSISNVNLEQGVYIFLDEEAVRVLKTMPDWLPGQTNGENIRVKVYIPIVFKR